NEKMLVRLMSARLRSNEQGSWYEPWDERVHFSHPLGPRLFGSVLLHRMRHRRCYFLARHAECPGRPRLQAGTIRSERVAGLQTRTDGPRGGAHLRHAARVTRGSVGERLSFAPRARATRGLPGEHLTRLCGSGDW